VWSEAEAEGLNSYSCPTCGAELVCDETTAATTCPYCGNPTSASAGRRLLPAEDSKTGRNTLAS